MGIRLFTVQHNFEHAYAASNATWDLDVGAMHGTSFLVLPSWLNWFTANIGYHTCITFGGDSHYRLVQSIGRMPICSNTFPD